MASINSNYLDDDSQGNILRSDDPLGIEAEKAVNLAKKALTRDSIPRQKCSPLMVTIAITLSALLVIAVALTVLTIYAVKNGANPY